MSLTDDERRHVNEIIDVIGGPKLEPRAAASPERPSPPEPSEWERLVAENPTAGEMATAWNQFACQRNAGENDYVALSYAVAAVLRLRAGAARPGAADPALREALEEAVAQMRRIAFWADGDAAKQLVEAAEEAERALAGGPAEPCTLDHTPNATTMAAMEAVERGEVEPLDLDELSAGSATEAALRDLDREIARSEAALAEEAIFWKNECGSAMGGSERRLALLGRVRTELARLSGSAGPAEPLETERLRAALREIADGKRHANKVYPNGSWSDEHTDDCPACLAARALRDQPDAPSPDMENR